MQTVKITFKDHEDDFYDKDLSIHAIIDLSASFVDIPSILDIYEKVVLFRIKHIQFMTTLNLTEITPYVLLFFDKDLNYQGASYSIESGIGPFSIQTQSKFILFLRIPHDLKLNEIISLTL